MTREELNKQIKLAEAELEERKRELWRKYAYVHNPYKTGDIFTDHIGSILIEKIAVYVGLGEVSCRYHGPVLKKDGTPVKSGEKRWGYQSNDVKTKTP